MNSIQNLIDTHTALGILGQVYFVALAMLLLQFRRTGRSFTFPLYLATMLPAILGTVSAYLQLQEARGVMNTTLSSTLTPDLAVRSIFWVLGTGIASSFILLALGTFFLPQKKQKQRQSPVRKESPVCSLSSVRGAMGRDGQRATRPVLSATQA